MFSKSNLSKMGIAAAIIAVGSMATVDLAEAKRGDGARNGNKLTAAQKASRKAKRKKNTVVTTTRKTVTQHRVAAAPPAVHRRKKKKGWKKFGRALGTIAVAAVQAQRHQNRQHNDVQYRRHNNHVDIHVTERRHGWNRGHRSHNRDFGRRCVAVAKTRHGRGRKIGNIRAEAFGRRACRKAVNRCSSKLYNRRQSRGRNPHAECVVAFRG